MREDTSTDRDITKLIVAFRNFTNAPETKADTGCFRILLEKLTVVKLFRRAISMMQTDRSLLYTKRNKH